MSFERVEAVIPEPPVGSDPADQLGEPGGPQLVDPPLSFGPWLDQPCLAQDPQVSRRVRLAEAGLRRDLADRPRPRREQVEDLAARDLRDRIEDLTARRAHEYIQSFTYINVKQYIGRATRSARSGDSPSAAVGPSCASTTCSLTGEVEWTCVAQDIAYFTPTDEWVGTTIRFRLTPIEGGERTGLEFVHEGLVGLGCEEMCVKGRDHYIRTRLRALVESGQGAPGPGAGSAVS